MIAHDARVHSSKKKTTTLSEARISRSIPCRKFRLDFDSSALVSKLPIGRLRSGYGWHGFGILRNHFHLQCYSVYRRFARRGKPEFLRLPERQNAIWSAGLSR